MKNSTGSFVALAVRIKPKWNVNWFFLSLTVEKKVVRIKPKWNVNLLPTTKLKGLLC